MNTIRQILLNARERMRKILIFSDLHATRITLTTAEFLLAMQLIFYPEYHDALHMQEVLERWTWIVGLLATVCGQIYFLLRGRYHSKDAVVFAGWNAMVWIGLSSVTLVARNEFPSVELALTFSASWIFIRSGFPVYGKRSSDYADADR